MWDCGLKNGGKVAQWKVEFPRAVARGMHERRYMTDNGTTQAGGGRHLSMMAAWGLSFGFAVRWGAFVMPGAEFLPSAGPLGRGWGFS